jgi:hypothetical protein
LTRTDFYRIRRVFKKNDSRRQYPGARAALKDDAIPDIPVVVNDDSPSAGYDKNPSGSKATCKVKCVFCYNISLFE